jgi:pyruvate dehydrogenase E2 component (dihydrolipoamide acetyltransferase)
VKSDAIKASPIARRLAEERGLQLERLKGTGPGGRIVKKDVEAAAQDGGGADRMTTPAQPEQGVDTPPDTATASDEPRTQHFPHRAPPADAPATTDDARGAVTEHTLSRLQQTVARRMAESKATAPDFVLEAEVDMNEVIAMRQQLKATHGDNGSVPSINDFVVKASASALRSFPRANGAYRDGSVELYSRVNVGVAVAGNDALLVPTVFDADAKSLLEIATDTRTLANRVREGAIRPPELSGGTFTVSNLGMFEIVRFAPIINPPQAAILAVGAVTPTPVIGEAELTTRMLMRVTLTCDHRILYGAEAAQFLGRIRHLLERPLSLAL